MAIRSIPYNASYGPKPPEPIEDFDAQRTDLTADVIAFFKEFEDTSLHLFEKRRQLKVIDECFNLFLEFCIRKSLYKN